MSMIDAVQSEFDRLIRNPYAEADPACTCCACGGKVYEGEKIYYDRKTGLPIGCEHCIDYKLA